MRYELEFTNFNSKISYITLVDDFQSDYISYSIMGNIIYNYTIHSEIITPYLGVGIGVSFSNLNNINHSTIENDEIDFLELTNNESLNYKQFIYSVITGISTEIKDNIFLDSGVQYKGVINKDKFYVKDAWEESLISTPDDQNISFMMGLRFTF